MIRSPKSSDRQRIERTRLSDHPNPDIPDLEELRDLASRIRFCRKRMGLTQVEFASTLGVAPRTVQNWEAGKQYGGAEPTLDHIRAIEKASKVKHGFLLYDGDPDDPDVPASWIRRLGAFGTTLFGVFALVFPSAGVAISCHCSAVMPAREPRVKLARRSDHGRGRKGKGFEVVRSDSRHPTKEETQ